MDIGTVYLRTDLENFGSQPLKNLKWCVCLNKLYHFKFFKGCPPQILLGPYLYSIEIGSNYMMLLSFVNLNYNWSQFNAGSNFYLNNLTTNVAII